MISRQTRRGIILLCLLAIFTWIVARPAPEPESKPLSGLDTRLNYALRDFKGRLLDDEGQTRIELEAPLLRNDASSGVGTIDSPNFRIQQEDEEWYISAESALIAADREHVTLQGAVKLIRRNDLTGELTNIDTSDVLLNITPRTASTLADVQILQAGSRLTATGMNLDMINEQYELLEAVSVHYEID